MEVVKAFARVSFLPCIFSLSLLFFVSACGQASPEAGGEIDDVEAAKPDKGLNEPDPDGGDVGPKACLGRVVTEDSSLNIRTEPMISNNICGTASSNSYVTILDTETVNGFFKVTTDICDSDEQFVFASFIELGEDCELGDEPDQPPPPEETPVENIEDLGEFIEEYLEKVSVVREVIRGGARGRVEVFRVPSSGERTICGSKHIRAYRSEPYLGKDSLCSWTAVVSEYRKRFCPDNDEHCKVMVGDHTFGERLPSRWPHRSHRRGWCMDVWPMRNPGCGEAEVTWRSDCYNRPLTRELVELMVKHGADKGNQLFFNDPQMPHVRPLRNHDGHIHVCFKPSNSIVERQCDETEVDNQLCPEFVEAATRNHSLN